MFASLLHQKSYSPIDARIDLCALKRFDEAREPAQNALRIFRRDLGRLNEYTRAAFANVYQILKELKLEVGPVGQRLTTMLIPPRRSWRTSRSTTRPRTSKRRASSRAPKLPT